MEVKALVTAFVLGVLSVTSGYAGTFITTGQSVTGTTTTLPLDVSKVTPSPGSVSLSNSGGNLVVGFNSAAPNGDFYLMWQAAAGGLNFNTANYNYVQINIAAISPGMTNSAWQMYWQDDDSTVGGGLDSGITIGNVAPQTQPFSVVIDLKDGGTNITGANGWGPGTLDVFRIDPFQGTANKGQSFTISSITFGTQLTSLSGTGRNNTFTVTHKYASTVNGYFTTPHQIKARTFYEQFKIIDAYDPATITLANQLGYGPGSQTADVFVPTTYQTTKPVGIYIHINAGDSAGLPSNLDAVLQKHYLIGASPDKAGNDRHDAERFARVVDLVTTLKTKYNIHCRPTGWA